MPDMKQSQSMNRAAFLLAISNVSKNQPPAGFEGASYDELAETWASSAMNEQDRERFLKTCTSEALCEAFRAGRQTITFSWHDREQELQNKLTTRLIGAGNDDVLCVSTFSSTTRKGQGIQRDAFARAAFAACSLVLNLNLTLGEIDEEHVFQDKNGWLSGLPLPCSFAQLTEYLAATFVMEMWQEEYRRTFVREELIEKAQSGEPVSFGFVTPDNRNVQQTCFFFVEKEEVFCCLCLTEEQAQANLGLTVRGGTGLAAVPSDAGDLQFYYDMELKDVKRRHRRASWVVALVVLLIGIAGGAALDAHFGLYDQVVAMMMTSKTEPEVQTPAVTPAPVVRTEEKITKVEAEYHKETTFTTQVLTNGTARTNVSSNEFTDVEVQVTVTNVILPDQFAKNDQLRKYIKNGSEAAVMLDILCKTADASLTFVPQDALRFRVEDANGNTLEGYQLMDKLAGGSYNVSLTPGKKQTLYKRFHHDADAANLVITYYYDGERYDVYCPLVKEK